MLVHFLHTYNEANVAKFGKSKAQCTPKPTCYYLYMKQINYMHHTPQPLASLLIKYLKHVNNYNKDSVFVVNSHLPIKMCRLNEIEIKTQVKTTK